MKAAFLATASVPTIKLAIPHLRRHFGGAHVIAYVRDSVRTELEPDLQGFEVRSDRIRGRWLQVIRALRGERFDVVFVIFAGGSDHWKVKLVSFLAGGRSLFVFNEGGDFFEWNRANLPTIRQHLKWRLQAPVRDRGTFLPWLEPLMKLVAKLYSCTVGPLLGLLYLIMHVTLLEIGRARDHGKSGASS